MKYLYGICLENNFYLQLQLFNVPDGHFFSFMAQLCIFFRFGNCSQSGNVYHVFEESYLSSSFMKKLFLTKIKELA